MAGRRNSGDAQAVGGVDDAGIEADRGDVAESADSGSADNAGKLSVDTGEHALIDSATYNRIIKLCKTRPGVLFDVAMTLEGRADDTTIEEVLQGYGLQPDDLPVLLDNPVTGPQLKELRDDIREHGLGFKRKAAAMAEAFLPTVAAIINDYETPPHVKLQGISHLARWGGFEKAAGDSNAGGVTVQINFPSTEAPVKVITGEVVKEDG